MLKLAESSPPAADPVDLLSLNDVGENPNYLTRQLVTYIGNKRSLLEFIGRAVEHVKQRIGSNQLRSFDVFSGSGIVSRFLKFHSSYIVSNDLEGYAATASRCFLANRSEIDLRTLQDAVADLNARVEHPMARGFIEELYAPQDEKKITAADRVFYTQRNARRIDNYRRLIDTYPEWMRDLLVAPLLGLASVHVNTSGVFKGFYKDRDTGIGRFGGRGADALSRIKKPIALSAPTLSNFECDFTVLQEDANAAARQVSAIDLAYVDPPYNQHPYGSNYFMLNLIDRYQRPGRVSRVSGIPTNWQRSGYNVRAKSLPLLASLLDALDAKFLLVSFNNEGFIHLDAMRSMLNRLGNVLEFDAKYNTFRGCRNLRNRDIHVTEHLFLVEKS